MESNNGRDLKDSRTMESYDGWVEKYFKDHRTMEWLQMDLKGRRAVGS